MSAMGIFIKANITADALPTNLNTDLTIDIIKCAFITKHPAFDNPRKFYDFVFEL